MEKRALIAFVLSVVVFIGWGYYLSLMEEARPPVKKAEVREKMKTTPPRAQAPAPGLSGLPETPTTEDGVSPMTPPPAKPEFVGNEELIQVDTGIMSLVISNKGGVLHDALMPKYHNDDGTPINLVNRVEGVPLPLALESNNETVNRILQNAFYEVSTNSLILSETHPTEKLTLTLNHPSGLHVVREFVFQYNQFLVKTETRISAPSYADQNLQYTVYWGPGLGGQVSSKTDYFAFSGPTTFVNNERVETAADDFTDKVVHKGELEWTGFQNKYFAAVLVPEEGIKNAVTKKDGDQL
ncbi:MAG: membrane protein insertase YidC, partial [Nitrospinales bacterium]